MLSFCFIYPSQLEYASFTSLRLLPPFQSGFSMYGFLRTQLRSLCSPSRSKVTNSWVLCCWYPENCGAKHDNTDLNSCGDLVSMKYPEKCWTKCIAVLSSSYASYSSLLKPSISYFPINTALIFSTAKYCVPSE